MLPGFALHQFVLPILLLVFEDHSLSLLDIGADEINRGLLLFRHTQDSASPQVYLIFDDAEILLTVETDQLDVEFFHLQDPG